MLSRVAFGIWFTASVLFFRSEVFFSLGLTAPGLWRDTSVSRSNLPGRKPSSVSFAASACLSRIFSLISTSIANFLFPFSNIYLLL